MNFNKGGFKVKVISLFFKLINFSFWQKHHLEPLNKRSAQWLVYEEEPKKSATSLKVALFILLAEEAGFEPAVGD